MDIKAMQQECPAENTINVKKQPLFTVGKKIVSKISRYCLTLFPICGAILTDFKKGASNMNFCDLIKFLFGAFVLDVIREIIF